jgi:hypothetical protein
MNYRQLLNILQLVSEEQLEQTVTIITPNGEVFPAAGVTVGAEQDVLDVGHLVIAAEVLQG